MHQESENDATPQSASAQPLPPSDPLAIYQDYLDETSNGLLQGRPEVFCRRVLLPFVMRTIDSEIVLETPEDLLADAHVIVQSLKDLRLTHFIRLVREARFLDETTIEGWHRTYALQDAQTVTEPYNNRLILKKEHGIWKAASAEHELHAKGSLPLTIIDAAPGAFQDQWAKARATTTPQPMRAEPIYAAYLLGLDKSNHERDFEAWTSHFHFPMSLHLPDSDHVVDDPARIRATMFDPFCRHEIQGRPALVHRAVTYAEFLDDDRIIGYHKTYWRHDTDERLDPVISRYILRRVDGRYAAHDVTKALHDTFFETGDLTQYRSLPTLREIEHRRKTRAASPEQTHHEDDPR